MKERIYKDGKYIKEKFEEKFIPVTESGCWLWLGPYSLGGYGQVMVNYRGKRAHRVAWEIYKGEIPEGMCVLHHCDTPECVNPDHLWLGTHADNVADRVRKGRNADKRGEKHHTPKLTNEAVLAIRADERKYRIIAEDYEINYYTVCDIKRRHTWRHI